MTPEQLDKARADEAWSRLAAQAGAINVSPIGVGALAARLAREGWEPIDPDVVQANQIVDLYFGTASRDADNIAVRAALAAIKCGRELEREGK